MLDLRQVAFVLADGTKATHGLAQVATFTLLNVRRRFQLSAQISAQTCFDLSSFFSLRVQALHLL